MSSSTKIEFISNKLRHVDEQTWFDHLQDDGDDMTKEEKTASKKTGLKQVFFKGLFHKYIYELGLNFYTNLQKNENLVPKLPKNKFDTIKCVSEYKLLNRTKFLIADAHNHPEGAVFLELWASSKKINKNDSVFILLQQDLLSNFYKFWVPNEREAMKHTPDDKLRLTGILLSNQVCNYLPYVMGITAGGSWQQLDASRGHQALGCNLALDLFTDLKYTVQLPE